MFLDPRRVQFVESDPAGIAHFSTMFRFMEEAEHARWRAAGLAITDRSSPYAWPPAAVTFDFRTAAGVTRRDHGTMRAVEPPADIVSALRETLERAR
jgi:acyl-CoA thioesterase FadM